MALERSRCEERHAQLERQILSRSGRGRRSERPARTNFSTEVITPLRARSLENLLDEPRNCCDFDEQTPAYPASLDDLDLPAIPRLSKSMKELPSSVLVCSKTSFKKEQINGDASDVEDRVHGSLAVSSPSLMWAQQLHHRVNSRKKFRFKVQFILIENRYRFALRIYGSFHEKFPAFSGRKTRFFQIRLVLKTADLQKPRIDGFSTSLTPGKDFLLPYII